MNSLNTHTLNNQSISWTPSYIRTPLVNWSQIYIYIKPTDKTLLLHHTSFHPNPCKNAIIYSQALLYRPVITDNDRLHKRLNDLLIVRTYATRIQKKTQFKRHSTKHINTRKLNYSIKQKLINNSTIFSIPYNMNTKYIAQILCKHWDLIKGGPILRILWPEPPIVSYQRNRNFKDQLVHSKSNLRTNITTQMIPLSLPLNSRSSFTNPQHLDSWSQTHNKTTMEQHT